LPSQTQLLLNAALPAQYLTRISQQLTPPAANTSALALCFVGLLTRTVKYDCGGFAISRMPCQVSLFTASLGKLVRNAG